MRSSAERANSTLASTLPHICICVCTYKHPPALKRLLLKLENLETGGLFTYSIVVVDNDDTRSAEATVAELRRSLVVPVRYEVEPRRNIALARNKAVASAEGEYLALIDDDEFPEANWLLTLFNMCRQCPVDGVLGPVLRHFDAAPPAWLRKSHIYDRRVKATGTPVEWKGARTGNVLLKAEVISGAMPFRPEFRAGEDQDFFRRKIEEGFRFIWCADAIVFETIPPSRWKRRYVLRKATLQGATAALQPDCNAVSIAKSIVAVPFYLLISPFSLLLGQHRFMTLMVKLFDHSGKLLRVVGINPIREEYVSE